LVSGGEAHHVDGQLDGIGSLAGQLIDAADAIAGLKATLETREYHCDKV
jgi:hypothetical protein